MNYKYGIYLMKKGKRK